MQPYPIQYFRLLLADTDNIVISKDSHLIVGKQVGNRDEKWYLKEKEPGVFQIVNDRTGKFLTAADSKIILDTNSNSPSQLWRIEGILKDIEGNYLYYLIINNKDKDSTQCLTFTDGEGFSLTRFQGERFQKFKIHLDGLQGFADNHRASNNFCQKWNILPYSLDANLTMSNPIVKTQVFKDKDYVHTVVFMK